MKEKRDPKTMSDAMLKNALAWWQEREGYQVFDQEQVNRYCAIERECVNRGFLQEFARGRNVASDIQEVYA